MYVAIKRAADIVISFAAVILLSPIFFITSILIKIDSKGPVFFKQERLGMDGNVFVMYKFRSMCVGAEKIGSKQYSFKGDARVTKVGKIIRLLSIDELPQLFNIIKGDMSLIGPRPTLTYHPWTLDKYTPEQLRRFSVRPGVTGLAQINGRKCLDWNKRIEYDVYYVDNMSLRLDAEIFFKTIFKVVAMKDNESKGKTAYPKESDTDA